MLTFKQYNQNQIDEGFFDFFKKIGRAVSNLIKRAFSKLKFGKKISINISKQIPKKVFEAAGETIDLKSRLGYLSEYSTAKYMSDLMEGNGYNLTNRSKSSVTTAVYNKMRNELNRLGAPTKELERMDFAGQTLAKGIVGDINFNGEDPMFLTFDIEMTGDSGKGTTKADLILHVYKESTKNVVDSIVASLKAYQSTNINLANSTYISLFKTLFYEDPKSLPTSTSEFVEKFVKDFGSKSDIDKILDFQNIIGSKMQSGMDKAAARKEAKATHGDVIELMSKIFKEHYSKNKERLNKRMLFLLGLDSSDDFYASIGKGKSQKLLSSRRSAEFKKIINELNKGFVINVERNGNTNNGNIMFTAINGEVLLKATITFTDTGGKAAQGKTNVFVNVKDWL